MLTQRNQHAVVNPKQSTTSGSTNRIKARTNSAGDSKMSEVAAAVMIQRVLRGKEGREKAKRLRLWKAWNTLDSKEESELVHTHESYEQLKRQYDQLRGQQRGALQSDNATSETKTGTQPRAASPSGRSETKSTLSPTPSHPSVTVRTTKKIVNMKSTACLYLFLYLCAFVFVFASVYLFVSVYFCI